MTDAFRIDGPIDAFYIDDPGLRRTAGSLALEFKTLAKELDNHTTFAKFTNITGAVVCGAGAVVTVIGIAALPFTGGLSAPVAAVGGIVGAAGGLTAGAAVSAQKIIEKNKMKDVLAKWSTFCDGIRNALRREPEILSRMKQAWREDVNWELLGISGSVLLLLTRGLLEIIAKSIELHRQNKLQAGDIIRRMADILEEFAQTGKIR